MTVKSPVLGAAPLVLRVECFFLATKSAKMGTFFGIRIMRERLPSTHASGGFAGVLFWRETMSNFNLNPFAPKKKTFLQRHEAAIVGGAAAGITAVLTASALKLCGRSIAAAAAVAADFAEGFKEGLEEAAAEADEKKADEKKAA